MFIIIGPSYTVNAKVQIILVYLIPIYLTGTEPSHQTFHPARRLWCKLHYFILLLYIYTSKEQNHSIEHSTQSGAISLYVWYLYIHGNGEKAFKFVQETFIQNMFHQFWNPLQLLLGKHIVRHITCKLH